MKKFLIFIFMLIINIFFAFSNNKPNDFVKRTILILPFINTNHVKEYDYLSDILADTLKSELLKTDQFSFVDSDQLEQEVINSNLVIDENNVEAISKIALKFKADVAVIGKYIIIEDKILIQVDALDIFIGQSSVSTNIKGNVGLDIFRIVDHVSKNMSEKMARVLKMVDSSYFNQMTQLLEDERRLKLNTIFTPILKTGLSLTVIGASFTLIGIPILIYDLSYYYSNNVIKSYQNNPKTDAGYNDYQNAYYVFIGLFAFSLSMIIQGFIMVAVGVPLMVIKIKKKSNLSLLFEIGQENISFGFRWRLDNS